MELNGDDQLVLPLLAKVTESSPALTAKARQQCVELITELLKTVVLQERKKEAGDD